MPLEYNFNAEKAILDLFLSWLKEMNYEIFIFGDDSEYYHRATDEVKELFMKWLDDMSGVQ